MVLSGFGFRHGIVFWAALVYLTFMLPLPHFIYQQLSIALQQVSSQLGVWFIRLAGVPVYLEGNVIDLGIYKLQVAEACSGLRYLFPLMSFGFLFAVLYQGPAWHKALLFLSSVPITILMNSVRIGVTGLMVDRFGIDQAEGFLHLFEGWIIFAACIGLLFLLTLGLQLFARERKPLSQLLDLDRPSFGAQARDLAVAPVNRGQVVLMVAALAGVVGGLLVPERQFERVEREVFATFPMQIEGWSGNTGNLTQDVETVLGADDYFLGEFTSAGATAGVGLFMAFYHDVTDGSGVHSPEVCLPSAGWEVAAWRSRDVRLDTAAGEVVIPVNRTVIQSGTSRQVVWYWFEQHGRRTVSSYALKFYAIYDRLFAGRSDAGIVRLVTPILPGESESDAEARLAAFLAVAKPEFARFMPG
jgi:exosortase D (VPLPA-CTERM-specific)